MPSYSFTDEELNSLPDTENNQIKYSFSDEELNSLPDSLTLSGETQLTTPELAGNIKPIGGLNDKMVRFISPGIEAANSALGGIPRYLSRKAGYDLPPAETEGEKGAREIGNVVGFVEGLPMKTGVKLASKLFKSNKLLPTIAKEATGLGIASALETPESTQKTGEDFINIPERSKQAKIGASFGALLGGVSKGIESASNFAKKIIPELADHFMASGMKLEKRVARKVAQDNFAGVQPSTWLNERGISGSVDSVTRKLDNIAERSFNAVNRTLSKIKEKFNYPFSENLLKLVGDEFKNPISEKGLQKNINFENLLNKVSNGEGLTLTELNYIKRNLDSFASPFNTQGQLKQGFSAYDVGNARNDLKKFIEDKAKVNGVPNIRDLNKDVQISTEISKGLKFNKNQTAGNRILSLTDFIVGAGVGLGTNSKEAGIGTTAALIGGKKILENPRVMTAIAKGLQALSGRELKALEVLKDRGIDPNKSQIFRKIMNKFWDSTPMLKEIKASGYLSKMNQNKE